MKNRLSRCLFAAMLLLPAFGVSAQSAAALTNALGKPGRMLVGLGSGNSTSSISSQGLKPDILDTYLVGVGSGSWIDWSSPSGSYVTGVASQAESFGAVPMYTLYQMAANGDGNITGISNGSFMQSYFSQARLMFQKIGAYGKPALVNLEPDFWGYVELKAPNHDATQLYADVQGQSECANLPNTAAGIAQCLLKLGRTYAPNAKIGFPPSFFGESANDVGNFMRGLGAQNADYIVAQTSDRDAGCAEVASPPQECSGRTGPFFWDESNKSTPNYSQSIAAWQTVSQIENGLPLLYWQTPLGVPSTTPGGYNQHYRDNHVHYMLTNATQFTAINVFAVVFGAGASSQTTIDTDGGQFKTLFTQYLSKPAALGSGASGSVSNGTYKIINRNSGLALDDYQWQTGTAAVPALVDQYAYNGGANQRWIVTGTGGGQFSIVNAYTNQPLDVAAYGGSGSKVQLYPSSGGSNQRWTFKSVGGGYFTLSPAYNAALALDVNGFSTANLGVVQVYTLNNGTNQQWSFQAP